MNQTVGTTPLEDLGTTSGFEKGGVQVSRSGATLVGHRKGAKVAGFSFTKNGELRASENEPVPK